MIISRYLLASVNTPSELSLESRREFSKTPTEEHQNNTDNQPADAGCNNYRTLECQTHPFFSPKSTQNSTCPQSHIIQCMSKVKRYC